MNYTEALTGKLTRSELTAIFYKAVKEDQTDVIDRVGFLLDNNPDARIFKLDQPKPFLRTIPKGLSGAIDIATDYSNVPGLAKKSMSVSDLYDRINDLVLDAIKEGDLPWSKTWANSDYRLGCSFATGKPYSYANQLLIKSVFGELKNPFFLTLDRIKKEGGELKESFWLTDIFVIAQLWSFMYAGKRQAFYTIAAARDFVNEKFKGTKEEKAKRVSDAYRRFLTTETVINGDFVKGIDFKLLEKKYIAGANDVSNEPIKVAEAIVENFPTPKIPIKQESQDRAFYSPGHDSVTMPLMKDFVDSERYYATLFHELIHGTGHPKRLNRLKLAFFGDDNYAAEELVAEIGAAYLSAEAGILHHHVQNTAAYLKGWHKQLGGAIEEDSSFLLTAMKHAERAAEFVLQRNTSGTPAYVDKLAEKNDLKKEEENSVVENKKDEVQYLSTRKEYLQEVGYYFRKHLKAQYEFSPVVVFNNFWNSSLHLDFIKELNKPAKNDVEGRKEFAKATKKIPTFKEMQPYLKDLKGSADIELFASERIRLEKAKKEAAAAQKKELQKQLDLFELFAVLEDSKGLKNPNAHREQMMWQTYLLRIKHRRKTSNAKTLIGQANGVLKSFIGDKSIYIAKKTIAPVVKQTNSQNTFFQLLNLIELINNPYAIFETDNGHIVVTEMKDYNAKRYMAAVHIDSKKTAIVKSFDGKINQKDFNAWAFDGKLVYSRKGSNLVNKKGLAGPVDDLVDVIEVVQKIFPKDEVVVIDPVKEENTIIQPAVLSSAGEITAVPILPGKEKSLSYGNQIIKKNKGSKLDKFLDTISENNAPNDGDDVFSLNGELGKFTQELQRFRLSVVLIGESGAGKSEMFSQFIGGFLDLGDKVCVFDLEHGGLRSKETRASFGRNIPNYERLIQAGQLSVIGDAPDGLQSVREAADTGHYQTIAIDSWTELEELSKEFNNLRKDFPEINFICIFQMVDGKNIRGGNKPVFDAPVRVMCFKGDNEFDFSSNYAQIMKNRGNSIGGKYSMFHKKMIGDIQPQDIEPGTLEEELTQSWSGQSISL